MILLKCPMTKWLTGGCIFGGMLIMFLYFIVLLKLCNITYGLVQFWSIVSALLMIFSFIIVLR